MFNDDELKKIKEVLRDKNKDSDVLKIMKISDKFVKQDIEDIKQTFYNQINNIKSVNDIKKFLFNCSQVCLSDYESILKIMEIDDEFDKKN